MTALGYGPEIAFLNKPENAKEYGSLDKLPLVNRSTKLTQQGKPSSRRSSHVTDPGHSVEKYATVRNSSSGRGQALPLHL